jgi:protein transport protein SEC24
MITKVCVSHLPGMVVYILRHVIVAPEYFCNLDANLMRLDHLQRPELNKGTVDFAVPEEYWAQSPQPRIKPLYQPITSLPESDRRKPQPMDYVFAIDVSAEAIMPGFAGHACAIIKRALYGGESCAPCIPSQSRICIISFDTEVHFYDLSVSELLTSIFPAQSERLPALN